MLCSRKLPVGKKIIDKRGGGVYQVFPSKTFCLTVPKDFVEGGRYPDFPLKNFCLRVPKKFVEEPFCAVFQKISKSEKVYGSEARRRVSSFSVEKFLSHSAEKLRKRTLQCFTIFGYRKVLCSRRLCHDLLSNIFV